MTLLDDLRAMPTAPALAGRKVDPDKDFASKLEVSGSTAEVVIRDKPGAVNEGTARDFLESQGLTPEHYEVTGFKRSVWGSSDNPMESASFTFKRIGTGTDEERPPIDELVKLVKKHKPKAELPSGASGYLVALGDMQFGKIDGDGAEGALARTIDGLNRAADKLATHRKNGVEVGHVHIAWLGDHIEGFVSQGGANVFRTNLTLNEQIRLTRRVMLHALQLFAPMAERVSMAAIPGNHGEPQRFAGKGVTRYDDSHDTESLIAVADAAQLNPAAFGHVEFYVPETDELTVVLDVANTIIAHAHGHQWRPGKHFDWWKGQAFNSDSAMHVAQVLLAGHLHHEHLERDGKRTYLGAPALEAESTWWRHATGAGGCPGLVTALVKDGQMNPIEFIR